MKKNLLSLLILFTFSLSAQQAKQVYITLDMSGSMGGEKYELANYATQMIVSLCDKQDDVYLILGGTVYSLTNFQNPLSILQKPFHIIHESSTEIVDIITFCDKYKPTTNKESWLFIIGDGVWDYDNASHTRFIHGTNALEKKVKNGSLKVCYLQTGASSNPPFTDFVTELGGVDFQEANDPSTTQEKCNLFAQKIMGFSHERLELEPDNGEITFTTKLPISEFLIVYQDAINTSELPTIKRVTANGQNLHCQLKGTPSTIKLYPAFGTYEYIQFPNHVLLSGNVWRAKAKTSIPAGQSVTVSFDKKVILNNVRIYPICKDVTLGDFNLVPCSTNEQLKELDSGTYAICREKDMATIIVSLSDNIKQIIPEELLKKTKVKVVANNKPIKAKYQNGQFECEIKLKSETTTYFAEIDIPGYKLLTTSNQIIKKNDDCPPPIDETSKEVEKVYPPIPLGNVQFQQHMELRFTLTDASTRKLLDPNKFDLSVTLENGFLFEKPKVTVRGDTIIIYIDTKGDFCECLLPKDLKVKIVAVPKDGAVFENGKTYSRAVHPFYATLERSKWFVRCQWILYLIGCLFLFILYLRLMLRKNRFKKNAMINPFAWSKTKEEYNPMGGYRLRKKGFAAWLSRWFLPFDEKRSIFMNAPLANFTFIATESRSRIKFSKSDFNQDTMIVTGYDPTHANKKDTYIKLSDNGVIELQKEDGNKDGKLQFVAGKKNDEGGYKFLLLLLMLAAIASIGLLMFLMIKAL